MVSMEVRLRRLTVFSPRPFDDVVRRLTATIGRPDVGTFHRAVVEARTDADLQQLVGRSVGASGLMEFVRFDAGAVLANGGRESPRILRLLVGNPLIMREMARRVADAASYAPVTILVAEQGDGVRVSFDSLASVLAPYGDRDALTVAARLDEKIERLIDSAVA